MDWIFLAYIGTLAYNKISSLGDTVQGGIVEGQGDKLFGHLVGKISEKFDAQASAFGIA